MAYVRGGCKGELRLPRNPPLTKMEDVRWVFRSAALRLTNLRREEELRQSEARSMHGQHVGVTQVAADKVEETIQIFSVWQVD